MFLGYVVSKILNNDTTTTSYFVNLANDDFWFKADLLIWEVSGNFRGKSSVRADPATSHWDKEHLCATPACPLCPMGYLRLRGNNNAARSMKVLRQYYYTILLQLPERPQKNPCILSGSCHKLALIMRKLFIRT